MSGVFLINFFLFSLTFHKYYILSHKISIFLINLNNLYQSGTFCHTFFIFCHYSFFLCVFCNLQSFSFKFNWGFLSFFVDFTIFFL